MIATRTPEHPPCMLQSTDDARRAPRIRISPSLANHSTSSLVPETPSASRQTLAEHQIWGIGLANHVNMSIKLSKQTDSSSHRCTSYCCSRKDTRLTVVIATRTPECPPCVLQTTDEVKELYVFVSLRALPTTPQSRWFLKLQVRCGELFQNIQY